MKVNCSASLGAIRAAYADPPYLGCGRKHYGALHEAAADFDDPETHRRLIESLCDEFDSWALSLHEPSLRTILNMCPDDVRVAAWVKPFAAFKRNVTRAWCWEPVIFRFARNRTRDQQTWRDFVSEPIAMRKGFPGAKPDPFAYWIFEGLNLTPDDEFCDLLPGSGAVGRAWERWQMRFTPETFELVTNAEAQLPPEREARREPKARQRFGRSTAAIRYVSLLTLVTFKNWIQATLEKCLN